MPGVWVSVQRQLPVPEPRIAPADFNPRGFTFVQNSTFFWVDQAQGQWAPVTGSASAGGITVSVQATPTRRNHDANETDKEIHRLCIIPLTSEPVKMAILAEKLRTS